MTVAHEPQVRVAPVRTAISATVLQPPRTAPQMVP
jgi:hypothetical protein